MGTARRLLLEGLSDAVGFAGGALLGYGIGQALGWDVFDAGYGITSLLGIALVGLGGGAGLQLARRWRARRSAARDGVQDADLR